MSATNFYLNSGYTPTFRSVNLSGAGTFEVWTPTTSTRVILTELAISTVLGGSIRFTLGNLAGSKFAEFVLGGSANISPTIGAIESTMYDRSIFASASAGGTDNWKVTLFGFEIP